MMSSVTITEFLLARIAEDERVARAEVARVAGSPRRSGKAYALRMGRECEAKRRIVALWVSTAEDAAEPYPGMQDMADDTLRTLALCYVDHPDYDEAWRP